MISPKQIIKLYEDADGLTPEEICLACPGLEIEAVKSALLNGSRIYRERLKAKKEFITEDEHDLIKQGLMALAFSAENEHVKFRTLKYLHEEKTGRNDVRALTGVNINMNSLNVQLEEIKRLREESLKPKQIIDVEPEKVAA